MMKKFSIFFLLFLAINGSYGFSVASSEPDVRFFEFFDAVLNIFEAITTGALTAFTNLLNSLNTVVSGALTAVQTLASDVIQMVSTTTSKIVALLQQLLVIPLESGKAIQKALSFLDPMKGLAAIKDAINKLMSAIKNALAEAQAIQVAGLENLKKEIAALETLVNAIVANLTAAANNNNGGIFGILAAKPLSKTIGDATLKAIQTALETASKILSSLVNAIVNRIKESPFISFIRDSIIAGTKDLVSKALAQVQMIMEKIVNTLLQGINTTLSQLLQTLSSLVSQIQNQVQQAIQAAVSQISQILSQATQLTQDTISKIQAEIDAAVKNITDVSQKIGTDISNAINTLVQNIQADVQKAIQEIQKAANDVTTQINNAISSASVRTKKLGDCAITALSGVKPIIDQAIIGVIGCANTTIFTVTGSVQGIVTNVNTTIKSLTDQLQYCIQLTSETEVLACVSANFTKTVSQLVTFVEGIAQNVGPLSTLEVAFQQCLAGVVLNATTSLPSLATTFSTCITS